MSFEKYFKGDTLKLDMDYISTIPELMKLKECEQSKKWHGEGNAWKHTMNCVDVAYRIIEKEPYWSTRDDDKKRLAIISTLFHDIGKVETTEFKNGDWHSYGHDSVGERIARKILWEEDFDARETVCSVIRYHMERITFMRKGLNINDVLKLSYDTNIDLLLFVSTCDVMGSIQDETCTDNDINVIKTIKKIAIDNHCYDKPYEIYGSYLDTKNLLFRGKVPNEAIIDNRPTMWVMIGLSGAGKDTVIENLIPTENTVIVSRDEIRARLGMCKNGEKIVGTREQEEKVTEVFTKMLKQAIKEGKDVVINNINLKKKYRDDYKKILGKNDYRIVYYYVEAPSLKDNFLRHGGQVPMNVLEDMILKFDMPRNDEFDVMLINIQKEGEDS